MQPSMQAYQTAANAIYDPQMQAEGTQLKATRDTTVNSLESQKGQVTTDYQDAINQLTSSLQDQTGQLNQLYSQRLGGNFSGLQGNDMGQLFARTNQAQGIIESTRANKLSEITAGQTNADIMYNAGVASLTPKYQSLKTQYANDAYGSAVKDYNDTQYKNAQLGLSYAKLASDQTKSSQAQYKVAGKYNIDTGKNDNAKGYSFTGPNGKPVSLSQYISGAGMGGQDVIDLLVNGSSYDRSVASKVAKANPQNEQQLISLIKKYDTGKYYGF